MLRYVRKSWYLLAAAMLAAAISGCSGGQAALPGSQSPFGSAGAPFLRALGANRSPRFAVVRNQPPAPMMIGFLMTDGSVLTQDISGTNWYRYAPDSKGDYTNGTWKQLASLQAGYGPSAYASQVLADGRLMISGGEYNNPSNGYPLQLTNLGAVYDPVKNTWTPLSHPHRWQWIGDSPSSVLPDGRVLMGDKLHRWDAYLDPKTLAWSHASDAGKADFNSEEGWTLLADGTILTADVKNAPHAEIYNPAAGHWKSAGSTIVDLHSPGEPGCVKYGPKPQDCYRPPGEIGPAILRPDGTVFATGAGTGASGYGTGHTAIYDTKNGKWTAGPDFPNDDNAGDSYAMLEPSGDVLVMSIHYVLYEYDGKSFTQVSNASGPPLLLPTGQVLMLGSGQTVLYTPTGKPQAAWAPTVSKAPANVVPGKTYRITGTQFNGLSQAMSFGDEEQNATGYPLVRITNAGSGDVYYARTHDHSTMGIATGSKKVWTYFDVPKNIPSGKSTLVVVANGIASKPVTITVSAARRRTLQQR
ncbi:MAG TPA: hypothetical protein VHX17_02765 [Candidatus Cybelea sp.]|nr:hypothetical protein [Candidatus Cybelea sp.]